MLIRRTVLKLSLAALALWAAPLPAGAVGPEPKPLSPPVELTVGYQKVGHLAPMILIEDELKSSGSM